jgi:5-methylcytosine-specific restriction endonuclease McrA
MIDRNSFDDAKNWIERILPEKGIRTTILKFLIDSINFANKIDNGNWNLNLDKKGTFLRFNIGYEWSFEISEKNRTIVILALAEDVKNITINRVNDENIKLWIRKGLETMKRVPDSTVCKFHCSDTYKYIELLQKSNRNFIKYAIEHTNLRSNMKKAHSRGTIDYLNSIAKVINPTFSLSDQNIEEIENSNIELVKRLSTQELTKKIENVYQLQKVQVERQTYIRNPYLSELTKREANGICQDCHQPAPFISKSTGEPYLETHHIIPLSKGGSDSIDNLIALCPNCHRQRHYG